MLLSNVTVFFLSINVLSSRCLLIEHEHNSVDIIIRIIFLINVNKFYFVVNLYFSMISKQKIKFISSLKHNKYRLKSNCFIAEGEHVVNSFIDSNFEIKFIFSTNDLSHAYEKLDYSIITKKELYRISCLKNPSNVLAVIVKKQLEFTQNNITQAFPFILLDGVSDPGNLGSIIRTADWFGVNSIYLSDDCVDVFNPKVVQASMGSLARISVYRVNLPNLVFYLKKRDFTCYGACLSGENIYKINKHSKYALVFGNESHGISDQLQEKLDKKILIPSKNKFIDSLNVAVSFGIILSEFR